MYAFYLFIYGNVKGFIYLLEWFTKIKVSSKSMLYEEII